jgi:hypothetical protein
VKVSRKRGGVRIRLDDVERNLLVSLFSDLALALDDLAEDDPVRQRLYPAGYDDPDQAAEFREMTENSLRVDRDDRIAQCTADLGGEGELFLDADAADRWIKVLNDLRLAIGTRIGVSEDDDPEDLHEDEGADAVSSRVVYQWLTAVQDSVVVAVMGR